MENSNEIICITVSTKYDDILKICLPQNIKFFKKWYIVTDPADLATIQLVRAANNCDLLFFNFYEGGSKFNKGGAIRMAQLHVNAIHPNSNILLLDSDIFLPDNFGTIMNSISIEDNTLYGVASRTDYFTIRNLRQNKPSKVYNLTKEFVGFFQLYRNNDPKYLYEDSYNCAICDNKFVELFAHDKCLNIADLHVKHLGRPEVNWDSRRNKHDFTLL
jgi:hypothetical protein